MNITAIKSQINKSGRFSIFVDGEYSFSLSESGLLESKITAGMSLSDEQLKSLQERSNEDLLYQQALRYAMLRRRSEHEVRIYLKKQGGSDSSFAAIIARLVDLQAIDDKKYAHDFIATKQRLRPESRKKLTLELQAKHIAENVISAALSDSAEEVDELAALKSIISTKRKQSRYQDDMKMKQYLSRQGFNYSDIKSALAELDNES
jgi:regulatory protein